MVRHGQTCRCKFRYTVCRWTYVSFCFYLEISSRPAAEDRVSRLASRNGIIRGSLYTSQSVYLYAAYSIHKTFVKSGKPWTLSSLGSSCERILFDLCNLFIIAVGAVALATCLKTCFCGTGWKHLSPFAAHCWWRQWLQLQSSELNQHKGWSNDDRCGLSVRKDTTAKFRKSLSRFLFY